MARLLVDRVRHGRAPMRGLGFFLDLTGRAARLDESRHADESRDDDDDDAHESLLHRQPADFSWDTTLDGMVTVTAESRCPCLSGETYGNCCGPLHRGEAQASTATRLMRSRYSAFAVGDAAYLLDTWHAATRPSALDLDPTVRWYRLDILGSRGGGVLDTTGTVEFEAHYRAGSEGASQRESSRFERVAGRWLYVDAL